MPVYLPVPQSVLAEARERERKQSMLSEDAQRGIDWEDTPGTDDVADKVRAAAKPCAHAVAACGGRPWTESASTLMPAAAHAREHARESSRQRALFF